MTLRIARTNAAGSFVAKLLTVTVAVVFLVMPRLAQRLKLVEKFSAENFALAVVARNREVFDKLAEM